MDSEPKVTKTEQTYLMVAGVGAQEVYRVHFTIGDHGPFVLDFKQADFNPTNVKAKMAALAATIHALEP